MYQNNDTSMAALLTDLSLPVDKRILLHIMEYSKFENQFGSIQGQFFEGVLKAKDNLIGIMDVEEVLKDEN